MALPEERHEAHLRRVDRARNMARFYTLSVEMALFDSWSCTKAYGRIGARHGRIMVGLYPNEEEALAALSSLLRQKLRRGYVPANEAAPVRPPGR